MHTNHEWCILIFQLEYHTCFNTLKNTHPINSKIDWFKYNVILIQITKNNRGNNQNVNFRLLEMTPSTTCYKDNINGVHCQFSTM
jgi:hypothetical protein